MMFSRLFKRTPTSEAKKASPDPAVSSEAAGLPETGETSAERRETERYQTSVVSCELGEVSELSRTGLRMTFVGPCDLKIDQVLELTLSSPTCDVPVRGRVTRADRLGPLRFAIGILFIDLSTEDQERIECLARYGTARKPAPEADTAERMRRLSAAMNLPDHYATLGLTANATAEQIHKTFRALARKYHPDTNRDPSASAKFCEINAAHEVLGDPDKKREYDLLSGFGRAA